MVNIFHAAMTITIFATYMAIVPNTGSSIDHYWCNLGKERVLNITAITQRTDTSITVHIAYIASAILAAIPIVPFVRDVSSNYSRDVMICFLWELLF